MKAKRRGLYIPIQTLMSWLRAFQNGLARPHMLRLFVLRSVKPRFYSTE